MYSEKYYHNKNDNLKRPNILIRKRSIATYCLYTTYTVFKMGRLCEMKCNNGKPRN